MTEQLETASDTVFYSSASYIADGGTAEFVVSFPYLYLEDVHVFVGDEEKPVYPAISNLAPMPPYTIWWTSESTICFLNPPEQGATVRIQRITNRLTPEAEFNNASILTEDTLNTIFLQLLYVVQEAYDNLNGESAVAAKDRSEEILRLVTAMYEDFIAETDLFRSMTIEVETANEPPGHGSYSFEDGKMTLWIPRGEKGEQGLQGPAGPAAPPGEKGPMGDSPWSIAFGHFRLEGANLLMECTGTTEANDFSINPNTGELEVTV